MKQWVYWAGLAQVALAAASIAVPFALKWREGLAPVSALIRYMFYTYAVYIFSINVWFGVVSIVMPQILVGGSPLALAVTTFISLYWWARVALQFVFGRAEGRPQGLFFTLGEIGLWTLFLGLAIIYSAATLRNLGSL